MPWAKIDDRFHSHPKVIAAGDAAVGLHVRALSYCAAYLTDGRIPETFADKKRRSAERLVAVGLWGKNEQGFFVHDYLDFNPSREEVIAEREEARIRMNRTRTSPEQNPNFARSSPSPSRPVPIPRKDKDRTAVDLAQESQRAERQEAVSRLVDRASKRFRWKLTKTGLLAEHRFAGELLDLYPEEAIAAAIDRRQKLSSLRWLAEWMSANQAEATSPSRPAILDAPPGVAMPEEIRRQIAQLAAKKTLSGGLT